VKKLNTTETNVSRNKPKGKKVCCYTWGGEGWQKRAQRSGFALNFLCFFLCFKAKKENDKTEASAF